jgi:hypothetical protein
MMLAPYIVCACVCARPPAPGDWTAELGLGVYVLLPSASAGLAVEVAEGARLGLAYHTVGGLVHDFDLEGAIDLAPDWSLALLVSESLFALESFAGIETERADFGDGLASSLSLAYRWRDDEALALVTSAGVTLRWRGPSVPAAFLEVEAGWRDGDGEDAWFLRLRAIIPVAIEAWVVGFLPWVTVGRSWDL